MTNAARRRRAIGDCPNASSAAPRRSRNQNAHLSQGTHSPRQLRRGRHTCTASAFRRFTRRSPAPDQPLPQRLLAHFYLVLLRQVLAGQVGPKSLYFACTSFSVGSILKVVSGEQPP